MKLTIKSSQAVRADQDKEMASRKRLGETATMKQDEDTWYGKYRSSKLLNFAHINFVTL